MPPAKKSAANARKRRPAKMTPAHKKALAQGREESRHIAAYLDALDAHRPKRGRKRTPDSIKKRLAEVEAALPSASGIRKLDLAQRKLDLEAELSAKDVAVDLSGLRKNFVKYAAAYGKRKGISYAAWRQAGVSAQDLKAAGISRAAT